MLGVIGIGAAGNNIADEFALRGIPSIAINYSSKDLESLENVTDTLTLFGSQGVGKVRSDAQRLMENNWESAVEFVKKHMSTPSIEVVMVVFSTGGGSGSGSSPILIEMLQSEMSDKTFVACPVLPDLSEALVNQLNTLSTLDELSSIDIAILPIDNEKAKEKYGLIPKNKLYKVTNQTFVQLINEAISYTEKHSKYGVIDQKDILQLFKTNGILNISKLNMGDIADLKLNKREFTDKIKNCWNHSLFAEIEYNNIIRVGMIFDGQEGLMEYLRYDMIFDLFANYPIDVFEGNYIKNNSGCIISILAGLSWISSRIERIEKEVEYKKANINLSSNQSRTVNRFEELNNEIRKSNKQKVSVASILNKYKR